MRTIALFVVFVGACTSSQRDEAVRLHQPLEACAHAMCATGIALASTCDPCAASVCAADPYCCVAAWDATCVGEVMSICQQSCTAPADAGVDGDSGSTSFCAHALCTTGAALVPTCDPCTTPLCAADPYCCEVAWDTTCVGEVISICGKTCP
jgi:hypothetical protein